MASSTSQQETAPAPSPLPPKQEGYSEGLQHESASRGPNPVASLSPPAPTPKLRLHIEDLTHDGAKLFLRHIPDPHATFKAGLDSIIKHLYSSPSHSVSGSSSPNSKGEVHFAPSVPSTQSVTLILRDFSGVAYTTGSGADSSHKEIHFSLGYIAGTAKLADPGAELRGVITHELVHCYQHTHPEDAEGAPGPPSGLIEGIADFVRLKADLAPPHWRRPLGSGDLPKSWDSGYQQTAFFLEWLEHVKVGLGAIGMLNDRLLREGYVGDAMRLHAGNGDLGVADEKGDWERKGENHDPPEKQGFWQGLFGAGVLELWKEYAEYLDLTNANANST